MKDFIESLGAFQNQCNQIHVCMMMRVFERYSGWTGGCRHRKSTGKPEEFCLSYTPLPHLMLRLSPS